MRHGCDALLERSKALLQHAPVELGLAERIAVLNAFAEVARYRAWRLLAAHVRTNHVHVVVAAGASSGRIMGDLKAWATRRLVTAGHRPQGGRVWARQGGTRHLWHQAAVEAACSYVLYDQGEILPGTVEPAP
jgi:REP element-mobilizing transposase RayT